MFGNSILTIGVQGVLNCCKLHLHRTWKLMECFGYYRVVKVQVYRSVCFEHGFAVDHEKSFPKMNFEYYILQVSWSLWLQPWTDDILSRLDTAYRVSGWVAGISGDSTVGGTGCSPSSFARGRLTWHLGCFFGMQHEKKLYKLSFWNHGIYILRTRDIFLLMKTGG